VLFVFFARLLIHLGTNFSLIFFRPNSLTSSFLVYYSAPAAKAENRHGPPRTEPLSPVDA